jgi:hypothetical protein
VETEADAVKLRPGVLLVTWMPWDWGVTPPRGCVKVSDEGVAADDTEEVTTTWMGTTVGVEPSAVGVTVTAPSYVPAASEAVWNPSVRFCGLVPPERRDWSQLPPFAVDATLNATGVLGSVLVREIV